MTTQIITIDGPVASGKGTVASALAKELGWHYLDSGVLYRLLALLAENNGVGLDSERALVILAHSMQIQLMDNQVYLNAQNVTQAVREEKIGLMASQVAKLPEVRKALLVRQRSFAKQSNLVTDGRDMGSVVFPDAQLKVYLTASAQERARRRAAQMGVGYDGEEYQKIYQDILIRDERDRNRAVAPLKPAKNAKILDSSQLSVQETIKKIINWYQEISK